MRGHDHFEGKGHLVTKINNIIFFVRNEVLNIFNSTIFFRKKKTIFFKITLKNNFWRHGQFSGNGAPDDKNEYNLFYGKCGTEYGFVVFSSRNPHTAWMKAKNWFWAHFIPYQWFYQVDCFEKQQVSLMCGSSPSMWISWKSVQNSDCDNNNYYNLKT